VLLGFDMVELGFDGTPALFEAGLLLVSAFDGLKGAGKISLVGLDECDGLSCLSVFVGAERTEGEVGLKLSVLV
jgi:hypothetical protein